MEAYLHLPVWALQMEILPLETLTVQFLHVKLWETPSIFNSTDGKSSYYVGVYVFCAQCWEMPWKLLFSREAGLKQSLAPPPTLDF